MAERPAIFDGLLRGVPGKGKGEAPAEAFRDPQDVLGDPRKSLLMSKDNAEGKIFLGLLGADVVIDPKRETLPDGRTSRYAVGGTAIGIGDDRHIVTIAGSRAGKGRAILGPNLMVYPGSVLVIDPKGDLAQLTYDRRLAMGQEVHVLDPFGASGRPFPRAGFNPLDILVGSEDLLADAGLIADALVVPSPGEKDPHWNDSARNLVEGLILHVATWPAYAGRRHLLTVHELLRDVVKPMTGQPGIFPLELEMRGNTLANGAVAYAATDFYDRADRERDSVLSTARRHLHFLGYEKIAQTLTASSFDLQDLKRRPMSVFLTLPAMRMGSCARWLRLFVNLTLAAMERARVPDQRYPVLVVLDEFAVLGTMREVENAAGQIAGLGVKLHIVLQDLGQLKALYSERWETFLGNAGVLQFFGNNELTTLEWIARRLGTTGIVNRSETAASYDARATGATGQSQANATAELMTAAEVARIFGRDDHQLRQLIIRPTAAPLILQRGFYDTHAFFRGKFKELDRFAGR